MTTAVDTGLVIEFSVFGDPEPGGSKKAVPLGNGRYGVVDANPRAKGWKDRVAQVAGPYAHAAVESGLFDGPIVAEFWFYQPRPAGHYGTGRNAGSLKASAPSFPTVAPDALKLSRLVEDALQGVLYRNDAAIVEEHLFKRYGAPARCEVVLRAAA